MAILKNFINIFNDKRILIWYIFTISLTLLPFWLAKKYLECFNLLVATTLYFIIVSLIICSYPIERLLRYMLNFRRVATAREKERLEEFQIKLDKNSYKIDLFIVDEMSINAYSLNKRTIAVSRGLLETMNDDEVFACLLHELAHVNNNDACVRMIIKSATNIYLFCFYIISSLLLRLERITNNVFIRFFRRFFELPQRLIDFMSNFIFARVIKNSEYEADMFVCKNDYEEALLSALYKFYDLEISNKRKLVEQLKQEHPRVAFRIEKVEQYISS